MSLQEAITEFGGQFRGRVIEPAYLNFMMEEGEDRIRATYRGNYARLAAVKAKYDPENFFRENQNIRPAA